MKKGLILSRNILVNLVCQALVFAVAFFTTPIVLKGLGRTYYSLLIFLITLIGFFNAFDFGFAPAYLQAFSEAAGKKKDYSKLFWTSLYFHLGLALIWSLLIFIFSPYLLNNFFPIVRQVGQIAVLALRVFSVVLLLNSISSFFFLSFQGLQKFHLANLKPVLLGVVVPIGSVWLLYTGRGLMEIVYLNLFTNLGIVVLFIILIKNNLNLKKDKFFSLAVFKKLFSFAKWKLIGQLAGQIRQKSSNFFLSFYLSLDSLAFFAVPQNLGERYISILANMTTPVFTMTAKLAGEKKEQALLKLYCFSVKLVNVALLPVGIYIFFYGHDFLRLWIGREFASQAGLILKILITAFSLSLLNGPPAVFLEGRGKPILPAGISILIAGLFIFFSVLLIPRFGLVGASLAFVFPYFVQVPIFLILATKKILGKLSRQFFLNNYFYPILMAVISGLITSFLAKPAGNWFVFIFYGLGFLLIYALLILSFGLVSKEEKELIKNLWQSRL